MGFRCCHGQGSRNTIHSIVGRDYYTGSNSEGGVDTSHPSPRPAISVLHRQCQAPGQLPRKLWGKERVPLRENSLSGASFLEQKPGALQVSRASMPLDATLIRGIMSPHKSRRISKVQTWQVNVSRVVLSETRTTVTCARRIDV